jgi:hypothetical protein
MKSFREADFGNADFLFPFPSSQLVTSYHPPKSQYSSALRVYNQHKNRSPDLLATDASRVFLRPAASNAGSEDGSDYVNASWLMGEYYARMRVKNTWDPTPE